MGSKLYNFDKTREALRDNLRTARKQAGYKTQEAFAEALVCSVESVRNWEQGRTVPEIGTLFQIAELLDCDLDYLIGRIERPTHDLEYISRQLRLSEEAVRKLEKIAFTDRATGNSGALSRFIEHENFEYLISLMNTQLSGRIETGLPTRSYTVVEKQAVINNEARSIFDQIDRDVNKRATPLTDERILYNFVYGLHADGRITDEQLREIIEQYDSGNFEYSPPELVNSIKSNV